MPSTNLNILLPKNKNNNQSLPSIRLDMTGMDSCVAGSGNLRKLPKFNNELNLFNNKESSFLSPLSSTKVLRRKSSIFPTLTKIPSIKKVDLPKRVDIVSRFTFPTLFFLFLSIKH